MKLSLLLGIAFDLPQAALPGIATMQQSLASLTGSPAADEQPDLTALVPPSASSAPSAPSARGNTAQPGMKVAFAAESAPPPIPAPPVTNAEPAQPLVGDLMNREALQRKQEELSRREQELRQLQQQVDTRLEELKTLESKLQAMIKEAQGMKDDKFRHLVDVYTNMKAKQAAAVLETLDERIAVKILAGMRGRQAGEILTFVDAKKAARLSEALTRMQLPLE